MTALQQARDKVNSLQFGSDEWESAMEEVRSLVYAENDATDFGKHTSIDGDVWSV